MKSERAGGGRWLRVKCPAAAKHRTKRCFCGYGIYETAQKYISLCVLAVMKLIHLLSGVYRRDL